MVDGAGTSALFRDNPCFLGALAYLASRSSDGWAFSRWKVPMNDSFRFWKSYGMPAARILLHLAAGKEDCSTEEKAPFRPIGTDYRVTVVRKHQPFGFKSLLNCTKSFGQ